MPLGGYAQEPTPENLALSARRVGQPGLGMAAPQPQAPLINPRENPLGAAGLVLGDVAAGLRGQPLRSDKLVQQRAQEQQMQMEQQQLQARSAEIGLKVVEHYANNVGSLPPEEQEAALDHMQQSFQGAAPGMDLKLLARSAANMKSAQRQKFFGALKGTTDPKVISLVTALVEAGTEPEKISDLLLKSALTGPPEKKVPTTRNVREGSDIVNQEYDTATDAWKEVGRGPVSQQSTTVNLPPQQGAFEKGRGESESKQLDATTGKAAAARQRISALDVLDASLKKAPFHGPVADILTNATMLGREMGLNMADTKDAEIANSISNQLTMALRNPASGGGLPGAVSDADRNFLRASVPSLLNSKEGGPELVKIMKKLAQRDIEEAKLASEYADKHGRFDAAGFQTELDAYANKHPLFPEGAKAPGGKDDIFSQADAIIKGTASGKR